MARKKPSSNSQFAYYDVLYEDGSRRSNRKVPAELVDSLDGEDAIRAAIEAQDRDIAEKSGRAPLAIKAITRSAAR